MPHQNKFETYEPIDLKIEPEAYEKHKEILNALDEEISEILGDLSDGNIEDIERVGLGSEMADSLYIIRNNVKKLINLIDDPEIKIIQFSHFCDRIGNFGTYIGGVKERIIAGKKISAEMLESFSHSADNFKIYLSSCITDSEFLKTELETKEGVVVH